jgi:hypothetical protein
MMKRLILGLVLAATMIACGEASSSLPTVTEETGPCAQRAGTYRTSYAQISGDCGAGPVGDVSTIDAQPPASASERYSADNCEVTIVDSTSTTATGTVTINGKIEWNQDGSHGSGPITIDESGLDGTCHGSYQITSDRI